MRAQQRQYINLAAVAAARETARVETIARRYVRPACRAAASVGLYPDADFRLEVGLGNSSVVIKLLDPKLGLAACRYVPDDLAEEAPARLALAPIYASAYAEAHAEELALEALEGDLWKWNAAYDHAAGELGLDPDACRAAADLACPVYAAGAARRAELRALIAAR